MSKYVSVKDSNGYDFSHHFCDDDWESMKRLYADGRGSISLSESGSATLDGDNLFVKLQSSGGYRFYDLLASDVF